MNRIFKRSICMLLVMSAASASVPLLRPAAIAPVQHERLRLESIIPKGFAGWQVDRTIAPVIPPQDLAKKLENIYEETIALTYKNADGQRVMLSVAYGSNQTGKLRVHRPESCYTAQGFVIEKLREDVIAVPGGTVPVKRLLASSGTRLEPITYWIRVGDETVTSLLGQRIAQLKHGLTGDVPDGLIFRVSTVSGNTEVAFDIQDRFVSDLLDSLSAPSRRALTGVGAASTGAPHG